MKPYFIFKNKSSKEFDIIVNNLPPITFPVRRVETVQVPGRNGYLTIDDESYEPILKVTRCTAMNYNIIPQMQEWLSGEGEVLFSNDKNRYFKARIINQIDFNRLIRNKKTFDIHFYCQPEGYLLNSNDLQITEATTIYNPGNYKSAPIFKVYGTGSIELTINNRKIILTDILSDITLNSEIEEAYNDMTSNLNDDMQGEFPILDVGENNISWTGNVNKIEIKPNWVML
ncbi:distal tail protein Dit [Senegalia massiliensis]|uniref:Phage tail protein n=1 Tax=Senegalia massiliensis TaxID=1720316 RepID=A0A845QU54_9CLOT|nr:distal tail protein Dit [Senegalia massiliensis]NBI05761.1 phage tail protein [Senegalia massiliensis]